MEQVKLGKTGLMVTRLGFGGIPIQRLGEAEGMLSPCKLQLNKIN